MITKVAVVTMERLTVQLLATKSMEIKNSRSRSRAYIGVLKYSGIEDDMIYRSDVSYRSDLSSEVLMRIRFKIQGFAMACYIQ